MMPNNINNTCNYDAYTHVGETGDDQWVDVGLAPFYNMIIK